MITLECPSCKRTLLVGRFDTDPENAVVCEVICPDCDDGDFHESTFYDGDGNMIYGQ